MQKTAGFGVVLRKRVNQPRSYGERESPIKKASSGGFQELTPEGPLCVKLHTTQASVPLLPMQPTALSPRSFFRFVNEQDPFQVIDFMLKAAGQESFSFDDLELSLAVEGFYFDFGCPGYLTGYAGDA